MREVGVIAMIVGVLSCIGAFITHAWWIITLCMSGAALTGGQIVIAIFGTVFPPLGVLHGFWLWFH